MTTQSPTWREQGSAGSPGGDRATPGTMVGGRYELRTPIGNGGMGTVWRSTDTLLRRDVAVKEVILPPTMPKHEKDALCERTLREARAAAALSHPSVVQVYDVVTDGGRPWIVMELLDARSLADMVIDDGPLSPRAVAKIGIAMLGALEVAHAAGVLHRDVKPANVLICTDGRCVLTDFGVARLPTESKLTTPGMVLGSPHFISPERAVGGAFGPPSDLFSLGVTLYTAVEGGPPFDRGDPFETMRAVVEEAPRPPRLAGALQPVLWGLLDKDPSRRWTVDQARAVLRELLSGALSRSSQAHAHHDTDPHAVVRPPAGPPPALRTGEQVGGRAMLDPNESLTGQLARLRGTTAAGPGRSGARPALPAGRGPTPGRDDWRPEDRRGDDRHGEDRHTGDWRTGERRPAEARGAG
ncbi:MAG TPA: protein kinase, partial [Micromonosporaceae bacterium]